MGAHVLLTGATGFLGKVVLEHLMRLRESLGVARVTLLVRAKRDVAPAQRLAREIFASPCFAHCPPGWDRCVDAVEGELSQPNAGLLPEVAERLCAQVTHVVHCAASVDFDRPLAEAALANVVSTLHVLELARRMPRLEQLVSTSTAYVTPWRAGILPEALAPLPRPVDAIWADVQAGVDEKTLLGETGHPNTYTYTKCLAEHLLLQRRGDVPLSIVRPSIISASWRAPTPGWIDSKAAFAGFVVTIGAGLLQVIDANPHASLDIVPVDSVAERLVGAAFDRPAAGAPAPSNVNIVHAVAGSRHLAHVGQTSAAIVRFFRRHRVGRRPALGYLGRRNATFALQKLVRHRLVLGLATARARLSGDAKTVRRLRRARSTLATINAVFPYFTHHTFLFATRYPLPDDFAVPAYVEAVCRGAAVHLLRRDPRQVAVQRPARAPAASRDGDTWLTAGAQRLRQLVGGGDAFRRFAALRGDETWFRAGAAACVPGADVLFVAGAQSAGDAEVCQAVLAARPELGFAVPQAWDVHEVGAGMVGAATDADPTPKLFGSPSTAPRTWVLRRAPAARPTAARPLPAGLLRRLADAARPLVVVPVGLSYADAPGPDLAPKGGLARAVPAWFESLAGRPGAAGSVHVRCGAPLVVGGGDAAGAPSEAAIAALGGALVQALRDALMPHPAHLAAFLALHPKLGLEPARLATALRARGAHVLRASSGHAAPAPTLARAQEGRARQHWQRYFAAEMCARWPDATALGHYFADAADLASPHASPAPHGLLEALAAPILEGYANVASAVAATPPGESVRAEALLVAADVGQGEVGGAAIEALVALGVLRRRGATGALAQLVRARGSDAALARFAAGCALGARDQAGKPPRLRVTPAASVERGPASPAG